MLSFKACVALEDCSVTRYSRGPASVIFSVPAAYSFSELNTVASVFPVVMQFVMLTLLVWCAMLCESQAVYAIMQGPRGCGH